MQLNGLTYGFYQAFFRQTAPTLSVHSVMMGKGIYLHHIQNWVQNVIITLVNPLTSSSILNVFTNMFITKLKLLDAGCRIGFTH